MQTRQQSAGGRTLQRHTLRRLWPGRAVFVLAVLPAAVLHAFLLATAMFRPPLSSDGIYYHLPLSGSGWSATCTWLHIWALVYGNGEVWQSSRDNPLGHRTDHRAGHAAGGDAVRTAGRGRGQVAGELNPGGDHLACMVSVSPMVACSRMDRTWTCFSTTYLLAACYWVLRLARPGVKGVPPQRRAMAALAGLSLGMAVGTRLMVLGWGLVLLPAFVLAAWRAGRLKFDARRPARPRFFSMVCASPACSLLGSSYWYIRNGVQTG